METLISQTIGSLAQALEKKEISSVELTQAHLQQIRQREPEINAFITITEELALAGAKASDERRSKGESLSPLDGIPFALKDNYSVDGVRMTCASKMLNNYVPPYTAVAAENMFKAGAVLLGKNNMDEFAIGSSTENSAFGPVKNPLDATRVAGGSSGGSAACVAAREAVFSLGSDTGGSVRLPAACCGVVGLKPTYGMVSRRGIAPLASSLDQAGIIAKTVGDTALILKYLSSHDPYDSMSWPKAGFDLASLGTSVAGLKIGIPKEYIAGDLDPDALAWVEEAAEKLTKAGASVSTVSLPHTAYCLTCYYIIMTGEFSANMGRYDGLRYGERAAAEDYFTMVTNSRTQGLGPEIKTRIMFGAHILSEKQFEKYFIQAMKIRRLIAQDFEEVFKEVDCLLSPVQNGLPFHLGSREGDSVKMAMSDQMLIPANLAGLPAIAVPFGQAQGLPGAVQLLGKPFSEAQILTVANVLEGGNK
jgi:aspartyl-tRNA(Asn)/glutamyl-tRNA(Gln) amidotransferase subunit A